MLNKLFIRLSILAMLVMPMPLLAWSKLTTDIDINCEQIDLSLTCNYRTPNGDKLYGVKAYIKDQPLELVSEAFGFNKDEPIAILFLIDTSDPGRQNVIDKNKTHISTILEKLGPGYKVGLASFDKTLRILAPIGGSSFLLKKELNKMKAVGATTELYRNVIQALRYLGKQDVKRKLLVIMSDGQAEDKAYFHSDVIKLARKSNIVINSIGYPRTITLSVALQTLRRLSEETGGLYTETDANYNLPIGYTSQAFNNIVSGGSFSIQFEDNEDTRKLTSIRLEMLKSKGRIRLSIPVSFDLQPAFITAPVVTTASIPNATPTVPQLPVTITTKQAESQSVSLWLWYGILAAFIIIIIFILITLYLLWQRHAPANSTAESYEFKPYAYLIDQGNEDIFYPITKTIWRIGRDNDNELKLDDSSISRQHAEINRTIDGGFNILDKNSMNGVYINDEKVGKAMLQEGDVIEIGDIILKFSQYAPGYVDEEPTVMQKTKMPEISNS